MIIPPTNILYFQQKYLKRISVEAAWDYLKTINSAIEYGSYEVIVGVIDDGVVRAWCTQRNSNTICSYYFGSSQGSANKHKMIESMQNKNSIK